MWHACTVLAVVVGFSEGRFAAVDSGPAPASKEEIHAGIGVRATPRRLSGWEGVALGPLSVRRMWAGNPGVSSRFRLGAQGPGALMGLRPEVSWTRTFRVATPAVARRRARRRTRRSRVRLAPPFRDGFGLGLRGAFAGMAGRLSPDSGWTSWDVFAGSPDRGAGRFLLARTRTGSGSTRMRWIYQPGPRLETEWRLTRRGSRVRAGVRDGSTSLRVEMRAERAVARRTTRATRRRRTTRRTRADFVFNLSSGGWRFRGGFLADSLALRPGARLSRPLQGPGGRWEPAIAFSPGGGRSELEARLGFSPRARLGPIGFHLGAGIRRTDTGRATSVRPSLSAGIALRGRVLQAGLGWEVRESSRGFSPRAGLAGRIEFHPGPLDAFVRFRPARRNTGWSAGLSLRR